MRWLWRFLTQTRRSRLVCGLLIAGAVTVAATITLGGSGQSSSSASSSSSQEGCTTGPAEAEVRITIYGGGEAACAGFDRSAAKSSEQFWRPMPAATEEPGRELICSMAKGDLTLEVRDTGSHFYGNKICARMTAQGWREQEGPGQAVEHERETRETEARAATEQREEAERVQRQRAQALEEHKREAQESVERAKEAAREHSEEAHEQEEQAQRETAEHQEEDRRQRQEAHERQKEAAQRAEEERETQQENERSEEEAQRSEEEEARS